MQATQTGALAAKSGGEEFTGRGGLDLDEECPQMGRKPGLTNSASWCPCGPRCVRCGHPPHVAAHASPLGQPVGSKPVMHEYLPQWKS